MEELNIYCDGGARGNPGPAASSFIVLVNGKEIHNESKFLGETTNNVAEYNAVLMAFKWLSQYLEKNKYSKVIFFLDSQLVVKQLRGFYKIKSERLRPLILTIKKMENILNENIFYTYIPRNRNRRTDFLVNKILDEKTRQISRPRNSEKNM